MAEENDASCGAEIEEKVGKMFDRYRKTCNDVESLVTAFGKVKNQYPYSFEQISYVGKKIIKKVEKISKKMKKQN